MRKIHQYPEEPSFHRGSHVRFSKTVLVEMDEPILHLLAVCFIWRDHPDLPCSSRGLIYIARGEECIRKGESGGLMLILRNVDFGR